MDELFPIFHFVVVRSKIKHLGAEIQMMEDLMERHFEHGELGIMLTILKVSFLLLHLLSTAFLCTLFFYVCICLIFSSGY